MQLGFTSVTSLKTWQFSWVLTNFIKNYNFCGRLFSQQSSGQTLNDLYYDSSSNFQSNDWQQIQYNTDLLKQRQTNLNRNEGVN